MKRQILFVASDYSEFEQLERVLGEMQAQWNLTFANCGTAALDFLSQRPYDVVLADLDLSDLNGIDLLNEVWKSHPKTVRFLRSRSADNELMMKCVWGTHRLLLKPSEPETIKAAVERGLELDVWLGNKNIRALVSRMRTFPVMPSLYSKVIKELESPTASAENVAEIISRDLAMTTKIIQVVNSAFYGLQREVTDPAEAITILGMETVKALVLAIQTFTQLDKVKPLYFSIDKIWRHGIAVGNLAKQITLIETQNAALSQEAFTAGLMHDVGKAVLASNLDEHYSGAMALARKNQLPLPEVETEVFGASHAETGAYLLALWGLPSLIVEATALHHMPAKSSTKGFSLVTAVHVADALEHEKNPDKEGFLAPVIDMAYLQECGLEERLDVWREYYLGGIASKKAPAATARSAAVTPVAFQDGGKPWIQQPALLAGMAAGLLLTSFVLYKVFAPDTSNAQNLEVNVRPRSAGKASAQPSQVALETADKSSPAAASSTVSVPFPALQLQGIFYRADQSTALINGNSVTRGALVNGVRIVEITRNAVRVEYKGQEKLLYLK